MIPCIVLPVSRFHDIAEKTACTQMKGDINRSVLSTSSPLCGFWEPKYRKNNKVHLILRLGYQSIFDYFDDRLPSTDSPISQLPYIAQKTSCTKNVPMDVTFHLRHAPAF